ncbi:DUF4167 domain-containing protein [Tropicibacter sp. S64]|uniref:DUF4167 domain-containing protein n=1 Tax=Tropicibacter sp. S64 TaxID=3415122 RepID=UPI003C7D2EB8
MRSSKSRSRNKNNRNRNNSNSLGNVVNRVFDSNGPEGKVRGTPQQIIDKYNQLARDSALGNDRVATENFQQHAEHYLRLLSEAQKELDAKREQQERENRERQAQRDRERADRDATRGPRGDDEGESQPDVAEAQEPQHQPRPKRAPRHEPAGMGDQPDILDMSASDESEDDGPGLVETPESKADKPAEAAEEKPKPKKPRAPRKPRAKKVPEGESAPVAADTPPDAAE